MVCISADWQLYEHCGGCNGLGTYDNLSVDEARRCTSTYHLLIVPRT